MTHRLSALDATFYDVETRTSSMAVGVVCVFDGGALVGAHGEIDIERLGGYVESAIALFPRYRQRVIRVPGIGQPVWSDDPDFRLSFHLRQTRLPWPGDDRQLKRLAGRLFSERLDRDHPLWELWVVEGLRDGRFALIIKVHHCMIDGVAGASLLTALLRPTPDATIRPAAAWAPEPRRPGLALLRDEIRHHNHTAATLFRRLRTAVKAGTPEVGKALRGMAETLRVGLRPAPASPLNPKQIGPQRRFDTLQLDLAAIKRVKNALGGTVNDVALAVVAGALRRYLARRGSDLAALDGLRAMVPVNTRAPGQEGGNQVALVLVPLPIAVADPAARLRAITAHSHRLKTESGQIAGAALFEELADAVATRLLSSIVRLAVRIPAFNLTVTNVPGPPVPLYLLGARLTEIYPLVPLYETQALGVALFSYAGTLFVGLSACWHTIPDLHDLVGDVTAAFHELEHAAGVTSPPGFTEDHVPTAL